MGKRGRGKEEWRELCRWRREGGKEIEKRRKGKRDEGKDRGRERKKGRRRIRIKRGRRIRIKEVGRGRRKRRKPAAEIYHVLLKCSLQRRIIVANHFVLFPATLVPPADAIFKRLRRTAQRQATSPRKLL